MNALEKKIPPPVVGLLCAALMFGLARLTPQWSVSFPFQVWLSVLFLLVGALLNGNAVSRFIQQRTTVNPLKPDTASSLVTGGFYRFTRNPMYLGFAAILVAWAVYLGSIVSVAGIVLFVVFISRFQIAPEEQALNELFGEAYQTYCKEVRRWL